MRGGAGASTSYELRVRDYQGRQMSRERPEAQNEFSHSDPYTHSMRVGFLYSEDE